MSTVNDYHNKAMDLVERALIARVRGQAGEVEVIFAQALELELAAIAELGRAIEPTFSVLHRSAGWMAFHSKQLRRAEQLVATALAHDPPAEIAEELRDLLEEVNFRRHLELKGLTLSEDEFQMSLSGRAVGFGVVNSDELSSRIDESSRLLRRIVERHSRRPFREAGPLPKEIREGYPLFVSVPRAASFAVTLRLGQAEQLTLPGMSNISEIVDEFMDLMELVNESQVIGIQERIQDSAYLRNFLGLAKKIAPDGERVRQVGFTSIRNGTERFVSVTRPASEFPVPPVEESPLVDAVPVEIQGSLLYADARDSSSNRIRVIDENGRSHVVEVPSGMMSDVVRPMWDSVVTIMGTRQVGESIIILQDISRVDFD